MKTPGDVYTKSNRVFPVTPVAIEYPSEFQTRRVNPRGHISYDCVQYPITSSLAGLDVGIKLKANNRIEVWFDYLFLGEIDLNDRLFIRENEMS